MNSHTKQKLKEILSKILLIDEDKIHDQLSRKDVDDWDSMTHLIIISEIESYFDTILNDEDIMAIQTIGDITKILTKLGL